MRWVYLQTEVSSPKPIVGCFCSTFLAAEMLHVYRQITGLADVEPVVFTQKRQHADRFPFPDGNVVELSRPPGLLREWRRFASRRLSKSPPVTFRSELAELESGLRDRNVAVLHAYFGNSGPFLLPLLKSPTKPCPVIVSFHGADAGVDLEKPRYREAMLEVFANADAILARSDSLLQELESLGCPAENLHLSRTGIPMEDWPFCEARIFPEDGAWRIVQAGRLIEKKAYDVSLRAFARFRKDFPQATFELVGDGPFRENLEALADELGITEAVSFRGFLDQDELRSTYENAHLFLHPSRTGADGNREGVPNAMLEAMATGLPVVATDHGGIPEAVDDGASGFLVAEDDENAVLQRMQEIAGNAMLWTELGKTATQHVRERFERGAQIAALEAVYDSVI